MKEVYESAGEQGEKSVLTSENICYGWENASVYPGLIQSYGKILEIGVKFRYLKYPL